MGGYYLITYQWRRRGENWETANTVTDMAPELWLLERRQNAGATMYVLLNAREITKYAYDELGEWL